MWKKCYSRGLLERFGRVTINTTFFIFAWSTVCFLGEIVENAPGNPIFSPWNTCISLWNFKILPIKLHDFLWETVFLSEIYLKNYLFLAEILLKAISPWNQKKGNFFYLICKTTSLHLLTSFSAHRFNVNTLDRNRTKHFLIEKCSCFCSA